MNFQVPVNSTSLSPTVSLSLSYLTKVHTPSLVVIDSGIGFVGVTFSPLTFPFSGSGSRSVTSLGRVFVGSSLTNL